MIDLLIRRQPHRLAGSRATEGFTRLAWPVARAIRGNASVWNCGACAFGRGNLRPDCSYRHCRWSGQLGCDAHNIAIIKDLEIV